MNKLKENAIIIKKKEAYSLFKKFSYSKAVKLLNEIIKEDKNDYACFFLLGTSYLYEKDLDNSEKNLKISIQLNQKYHNSIHNLGIVYQLKENFNEAINLFIKALNLQPKNLGTLTHLAETYEKIKSFDKAKQYYNIALGIESKSKEANHGMARISLKFGYHKQGLNFLQKSTGLIRFSEKKFEIIE